MKCPRIDLRRKLLPFLEGGLTPAEGGRLRSHLVRCPDCRTALAGIRTGLTAVRELGAFQPAGCVPGPPGFDDLPAAVREAVSERPRFPGWLEAGHALVARPLVPALMSLVVVLSALLIVSGRGRMESPTAAMIAEPAAALDLARFHPLSIPEVPKNTRTRIVTEGYVRDVHYDAEEGTLHFRLSDVPEAAGGPFVVCEIMNPLVVPSPREGSRVRVYGVARYDPKPGRQWHEVNPVLNITELKY